MGPDGAKGCQMVPEGGKGCQKDQIGTVVAPGLGKTSDLIFVPRSSIAGVGGSRPGGYRCHDILLAGGNGISDGRTTWEP